MSTSAKDLGIDRLSVDEQLHLVEEIWDTIAAKVDACDLPQSHQEELDRRLEAQRSAPSPGSTWEEVKARLQSGKKPSR